MIEADADSPQGRQTQAQVLREALEEGWDDEETFRRLDAVAAGTRF